MTDLLRTTDTSDKPVTATPGQNNGTATLLKGAYLSIHAERRAKNAPWKFAPKFSPHPYRITCHREKRMGLSVPDRPHRNSQGIRCWQIVPFSLWACFATCGMALQARDTLNRVFRCAGHGHERFTNSPFFLTPRRSLSFASKEAYQRTDRLAGWLID